MLSLVQKRYFPIIFLCLFSWMSVVSATEELQQRQLPDFHAIQVEGGFVVNVMLSDEQSATMKTKQATLDNLSTEVKKGVLYIRQTHDAVSDPGTIIIQARQLKQLNTAGQAKVAIAGIADQQFTANIVGASVVRLVGHAREFVANTLGGAQVDASNLMVEKAAIHLKDKSEMRVNASDQLDITMHGDGLVEYMGRPGINQRIFGTGQVRRMS